MNFREVKEANELIDEIKKLDNFTLDIQNPARTLKVCTPFNEVTIKTEHRFKIIQVLLGMRSELAEELEKLGVTEYDDND
nr:MAG TPA: hypothetical protein [Caudoviricetes sp.]